MKHIVSTFYILFILASCSGASGKQTIKEETKTNPIDNMNVQEKSFAELFRPVEPEEFRKTLSELVGQKDHTVITAGTDALYNSMAASWEFMGHYFEKPVTFCLLGAQRYTLELIKEHQTYTMSFFADQFRGDVFAFGAKSGRNSNKMKETNLTHVLTPSGNSTYKEAEVVVECQLFEITTTHPDDFFDAEAKSFVENGHQEGGDYHKLVFGTVTNVWVRVSH